MIDAMEGWHYNEERDEEGSSSSRMSYTPVTDEEDPQEDKE